MHSSWSGAHQIVFGQILLIVCCIFYLIWWSVSYRPGETVSRIGGARGILLLITAASGVIGALVNMNGIRLAPAAAEHWNGTVINIAGLASYFILLLITYAGFKRPVTTELVLITGWTVLQLQTINALNAYGVLSEYSFGRLIVVIAAASILSLVLYILYYRMKPWPAYYLAMVPLISEAAAMAVTILSIRFA
ncbi:hypothetical protein [Catenisphaera adipataccumulans]|uniref:Uncharacterized protein n=1 Tax=Catenisphaera adipataccumulans TaxID=700500 RepID=A0A7W8FXH6_9FIRM|nr:hypothetical protein [Catenisphaera adipataccumulans]MBB5183745.1 hypothetical protein [Catenisphaera adipataccumulans]